LQTLRHTEARSSRLCNPAHILLDRPPDGAVLMAFMLWPQPNTGFGDAITRGDVPLAVFVHRVILARTVDSLDIR
jgi:hypothetical protein